jgi:hypothetical protein
MDQPAVWVDSLSIPPQQGAYSKSVSKVMQPGRSDTRRQVEVELGNKRVKRLADGLRGIYIRV